MDIYHRQYIGKIRIQKLDPIGYSVQLGLQTPDKPITIYAELEDAEFLKFIKQDLRDRRFNLIYFGELQLRYPTDCAPRSNKCGCHDQK